MRGFSNEVLIAAWREGDIAARDELLERFAPELKVIASAQLRRERGVSFSSGDLVNETVLRLVKIGQIRVNDKAHVMALAARLMRRILIDHARRQKAQSRDHVRLTLDEELDGQRNPNLIAVDTALVRLAAIDVELMALVEMRYFGGMALSDIAVVTGQSETTVKRRWRAARAWLADALARDAVLDKAADRG